MLIDSILVFIVRQAVATLFLWAFLTKVLDPKGLRDTIVTYGLLPSRLAWPATWSVLAIEVSLYAALTLSTPFVVPALLLGAGLLLIFAIAQAVNLARGRRIACGCFGASTRILTWRNVAGNLVGTLACTVAAALAARPGHVDPGFYPSLVIQLALSLALLQSLSLRQYRVNRAIG